MDKVEVPKGEMDQLVQLFRAGRMDDVAARAEGLIARYPHAVVLFSILGTAHGSRGRYDRAAQAFARAIAIKPDHAEGHYNLGNALLEQGKPEEAIARYRDALRIRENYPGAHNNIGNALKELGRPGEALAAFNAALALRPDYFEALYNLGNTLKELGRVDDAIAAYRRALAVRPDVADVHNNLGNALRESGKWEEAIAAFRHVVAIRPDYAGGHYNLGTALVEIEDYEEAIAAFRRAIAIRPDYAEAYNNLGNALLQQGEIDKAAAACGQALALRPDYANAWLGLGNVHKDRGELAEASRAFLRALSIRPDYVDARINLGNVLATEGKFEEAAATYRRAIAEQPTSELAHYSLAHLELRRGNFDIGWQEYEWRRAKADWYTRRRIPKPIWLGKEDIRGKSVFIHHEQGLGDTLHFMRYASLVRDRGAEVTMSVQRPLYPLLGNAIPGVEIVSGGETPREFDHHVPLMSLPLIFRTRLDTIPAEVPYLSAEPERVRKWDARLGPAGFKIGVCWQGSPGNRDWRRSFPLAQLAGIARLPGVRLISVHKGAGEDQLGVLPEGMSVEVPGPNFDPEGAAFLDTAAVLTLCDLVITSDTSVAHLAGALGLPMWVMLPVAPDWRWMADRDDSPWYPGARLFRQPRWGDWDSAFARAEDALRGLLERREPGERAIGL